ncbi:hypothetical protein ZIOFF_008135 [Zingiber officinale]|uniref:Ycf20-like protein n=1 Tax=Zingiber officinale TaxID=94328 RepID=A0A8J5I2T9_ZINOF|nr:hypothetical protein ZIOFF_008135 [Zingiber officinale]
MSHSEDARVVTKATTTSAGRDKDAHAFSAGRDEDSCAFFEGLQRRRDLCRYTQRKALALGAGGSPSGNGAENTEGDNAGVGRTRLGTIVGAAGVQLLEKLNAARKNLPTKIFLLLLGFYTANALATILGQTGDWDVLVAGVVVAAIEGIGMLMYRKPFTMPSGIFKSLIVMVNYWKAGVCLGLFVDAFKLGS